MENDLLTRVGWVSLLWGTALTVVLTLSDPDTAWRTPLWILASVLFLSGFLVLFWPQIKARFGGLQLRWPIVRKSAPSPNAKAENRIGPLHAGDPFDTPAKKDAIGLLLRTLDELEPWAERGNRLCRAWNEAVALLKPDEYRQDLQKWLEVHNAIGKRIDDIPEDNRFRSFSDIRALAQRTYLEKFLGPTSRFQHAVNVMDANMNQRQLDVLVGMPAGDVIMAIGSVVMKWKNETEKKAIKLRQELPPSMQSTRQVPLDRNGASLIFQEEERLSFGEIASRWEESSEHSADAGKVLNWLISDMWQGKFEDEDGGSKLQMPDSYRSISRGDHQVFLTKRDVEANRHRLFCLFARDCPKLFGEKFGKAPHLAEADWKTQRSQVDWTWLADCSLTFFDEAASIGSFKTRVLEQLTIARGDFESWLSKTKRPLPKAWGE